ncbi:unnamed protein product, partial [Strongylus vulgaris]
RIRATLGDDVSASYAAVRNAYALARSSRRSSLSQTSGDELSHSVDQLRGYISARQVRHFNFDKTFLHMMERTYPEQMNKSRRLNTSTPLANNRFSIDLVWAPQTVQLADQEHEHPIHHPSPSHTSYSPIRQRDETYKSLITAEKPPHTKLKTPDLLSTSQESLREERKLHPGVSSAPKNPSIRESSLEAEPEKPKKRSSKERTARRNSRQQAYTQSSSSEEEMDRSVTRADAKRRRRRRKESSAERGGLTVP